MSRQDLFSCDLIIGHANVETGHDRDFVVQDYKKFRGCDIVGFNEVYSANYWRYLRFVYKRKDWGKYPRFGRKGSADPILWRKNRFKVHARKSWFLHSGIQGLFGIRHLNGVLLEDKQTGEVFWVRNCHYVSKAWNGRQDKHDDLRKSRWVEGYDNDMRILASFPKNRLVISMGDYNRNGFKPYGDRARHFTFEGLDKVYVSPVGSVRGQSSRIHLNSNHRGTILGLTL